jgi:hypothetical protein
MYSDLAQISKSTGIYRTLALWTIISPKLGGNGNGRHPLQGAADRLSEQSFTVNTNKKAKDLSSPEQEESRCQ